MSFTGEESSFELDKILAQITNGTVDEIEDGIRRNMGMVPAFGLQSRRTNEVIERKFRNLKILVLWLQREKKFGRYCYYGCHCLPEGTHNIARGGYGKPVDALDASCRRFGQCYQCLVDEHKDDKFNINGVTECKGEEIGYQFDLNEDENGNKSIECVNKIGSCRRNICECDKQLAEGLYEHELSWDEKFHSRKSGFDRNNSCALPVSSPGVRFEKCCGSRTTFPFNEPKNNMQCCEGPQSLPNGQCSA